jgi:hypothetical protein
VLEKYLDDGTEIIEYVVRGGIIQCSAGSSTDVLNMPYSHGVFLKDQPQLNIKDSNSGENVISFGFCSIKLAGCSPSLPDDWINGAKTKLKIAGEEALLKDACLFCAVGGEITIVTSGQQ